MKKTIITLCFLLILLLMQLSCERRWDNPVDLDNDSFLVISPAGGVYNDSISVRISSPHMDKISIYYTLDESEPDSTSALYSGPIHLDQPKTLKAIAYADQNRSQVVSASYNFQVATPTFSPPGGAYTSVQNVSISTTTPNTTIRYATNGVEPTYTSPVYSPNPNIVALTTTISAKGFRDGWIPSSTASTVYTLTNTPQSHEILVPGGTFIMGDTRGGGYSNELPTHSVTLNSFYMGKFEITQADWTATMGSNPASGHGVGNDYPVYYVSWYAILKYCNLRSINEGFTPVYIISGSTDPATWGTIPTSNNSAWNEAICNWSANGYRLPTEAEWEYAARGATNNPDYLYSGSDDIDAVAWYSSNNSPWGSKPVGSKAPNGLGLHDMSGNVWEWCWDWLSNTYYSTSPSINPTGPASGSYRVFRGGHWNASPSLCRVSFRYGNTPYYKDSQSGFRICRAVP